jgi:hypothetical protein
VQAKAKERTTMTTAFADALPLNGRTHQSPPSLALTVRPRRRWPRKLRRRLSRGAAVAATLLVTVGMLALLVAEYGLLYHVVLVPWLQAVAPAGW